MSGQRSRPPLSRGGWVVVLPAVIALASACQHGTEHWRRKTAQWAQSSKDEVRVAVVGNSRVRCMLNEGAKLAADQVNGGGGVLGRRMKLVFEDDEGRPEKARRIAERLARRPEIGMVIGHLESEGSATLAIMYDSAGKVFLCPTVTHETLTGYGTALVFRGVLPEGEIARFLVDQARGSGHRKFSMVQENSSRTELELGLSFQNALAAYGVPLCRAYYDPWQEDLRPMIYNLTQQCDFDVLFVPGREGATRLIRQLRGMGVTGCLVGGPGLDSEALVKELGPEAEGLVVPTLFDSRSETAATRSFLAAFREEFGVDPDSAAARGYDSVGLLAKAISECNSAVPIEIASALRRIEGWEGAAGTYRYTPPGGLSSGTIALKRIRGGRLEYVNEVCEKDAGPGARPEEPASTGDPGLREGRGDGGVGE